MKAPLAVRDWIEQLVGQGLACRQGEYDTLSVTDSGWQVLRGQHTPRLLRPAAKKSASRSQRSGPAGDSWEGVDRGLFEHLRLLRNEHAAEASVPAYIVFGDDALRDMARRRPTSLESFRQCRGVGEKKLTDYGEEFTTAIHDYCIENSLDTNVGPEVVKPVRNEDGEGPTLTAGASPVSNSSAKANHSAKSPPKWAGPTAPRSAISTSSSPTTA